MIEFPNIDPVALSIGPLKIHWYGLMYLVAIIAAWFLALRRAQKPNAIIQRDQVEDLIIYSALGAVLGGRLGYVFFYKFDDFLNDPLWLFRVWEGGMSFHGGLLGVISAMGIYCRKFKKPFLGTMDFVAPLVPLGLGCGRIGNFIGGELYGRITDVPWGVRFPSDPDVARHPSQLYQAFLEGAVLFVILYWFSSRPRPRAAVSSLFLICYGAFRFFVEFYRQPDNHINFDLFGWMTRGQLLSIPMIIAGLALLYWSYSGQRQRQPG